MRRSNLHAPCHFIIGYFRCIMSQNKKMTTFFYCLTLCLPSQRNNSSKWSKHGMKRQTRFIIGFKHVCFIFSALHSLVCLGDSCHFLCTLSHVCKYAIQSNSLRSTAHMTIFYGNTCCNGLLRYQRCSGCNLCCCFTPVVMKAWEGVRPWGTQVADAAGIFTVSKLFTRNSAEIINFQTTTTRIAFTHFLTPSHESSLFCLNVKMRRKPNCMSPIYHFIQSSFVLLLFICIMHRSK